MGYRVWRLSAQQKVLFTSALALAPMIRESLLPHLGSRSLVCLKDSGKPIAWKDAQALRGCLSEAGPLARPASATVTSCPPACLPSPLLASHRDGVGVGTLGQRSYRQPCLSLMPPMAG